MIKINTQTLTPAREALPKYLQGLDSETLRNLQSIAKPVPPHILNVEYWPENDTRPVIDEAVEKYGDEIFAVDAVNKVVDVSRQVIALTQPEIDAVKQQGLDIRVGEIKAEAQRLLDEWARSRYYNDINSLCGFVNSTNTKFATEAARGVVVRDQTWTALDLILTDVLAGTRSIPTVVEAITEVPSITWGAA